MKLKQLGSNQTELVLNDGTQVLFSYETPVAMYDPSVRLYFRTAKKWSQTTSRHINKWLAGESASIAEQELFDEIVKGATA